MWNLRTSVFAPLLSLSLARSLPRSHSLSLSLARSRSLSLSLSLQIQKFDFPVGTYHKTPVHFAIFTLYSCQYVRLTRTVMWKSCGRVSGCDSTHHASYLFLMKSKDLNFLFWKLCVLWKFGLLNTLRYREGLQMCTVATGFLSNFTPLVHAQSISSLTNHYETIHTRVGTLIVATIYLQLIQNRYMFRSFTVLQCSHQNCVQPVASDVKS